MNTYGYVEANPLRYVDPTGQAAAVAPVVGIGIIGLCARFPRACGAAIGWGFCAITGTCNEIPDNIIIPGLPPRIRPEDTIPLVGVPSDILPPEIGDQCQKTYNDEIKKCGSCGNKISKAACRAKAKIKHWLCKGGKRPGFGDDDPGSGGGDGFYPF